MRKVTLINRVEKPSRYAPDSQAYILAFGAYGDTQLLVYARHLEDALDECIDWIAENAPGLLMNDAVNEAYQEAIDEGMSEDDARDDAEMDTTSGGNAGDYIASWEWCVVGEHMTPKEIADYVHGR